MQQINEEIRRQISNTLEKTDFPELGEKYEGKVRDNYTKGDIRIIITTDRVSAFDVVLGTIPMKGQVLNQLATFWFHKTKDIVRNHVIAVPDPNVIVVSEARPYPIEVVVRGYLTGSAWRAYEKGERVISGVRIPDGMRKNQKFPDPIITPSTKAEHGMHDEPISLEEIIDKGLVPEDKCKEIKEKAIQLFKRGTEIAAKQGLILVDTKYEFGYDEEGLILIDEFHTQDSSRYWVADTYLDRFNDGQDQQMLDKECVRQWCIRQGFMGNGRPPELSDQIKIEASKKYIDAFQRITGIEFKMYDEDINERIKKNLMKYGYL